MSEGYFPVSHSDNSGVAEHTVPLVDNSPLITFCPVQFSKKMQLYPHSLLPEEF
jgi:hypothetical protein